VAAWGCIDRGRRYRVDHRRCHLLCGVRCVVGANRDTERQREKDSELEIGSGMGGERREAQARESKMEQNVRAEHARFRVLLRSREADKTAWRDSSVIRKFGQQFGYVTDIFLPHHNMEVNPSRLWPCSSAPVKSH
jgi:hypothetical protein